MKESCEVVQMDLELKKNELHYYTALIRNRKQSESGNALRNVIQTMAVSRNGYVCGEDFSNLDFGNVPLNNIHFSVAGKFPCTFMQSEVTSMNFINGHAGDDIVHAEFSDDSKYLITWGDDGKIIVWDFWGCTICQSFQVEDDFGKALSYSLPNYIKISAAKRFSNKEIEKWIYESIIPKKRDFYMKYVLLMRVLLLLFFATLLRIINIYSVICLSI